MAANTDRIFMAEQIKVSEGSLIFYRRQKPRTAMRNLWSFIRTRGLQLDSFLGAVDAFEACNAPTWWHPPDSSSSSLFLTIYVFTPFSHTLITIVTHIPYDHFHRFQMNCRQFWKNTQRKWLGAECLLIRLSSGLQTILPKRQRSRPLQLNSKARVPDLPLYLFAGFIDGLSASFPIVHCGTCRAVATSTFDLIKASMNS